MAAEDTFMSLYEKTNISVPDPSNAAAKSAAIVANVHTTPGSVPEAVYSGNGSDRMPDADYIAQHNRHGKSDTNKAATVQPAKEF